MSDGLEQVPKSDLSSKGRVSYSSHEQVFAANSEKIVKNSLLINRNPPTNAQTYQEAADPCFDSIHKDYKQTKVNEKTMKGIVSKRLEGFPVILWSLESFIKWVKAEAERVAFEVTVTRRNKSNEDHWSKIKQAFKAELERIIQHRQAKS